MDNSDIFEDSFIKSNTNVSGLSEVVDDSLLEWENERTSNSSFASDTANAIANPKHGLEQYEGTQFTTPRSDVRQTLKKSNSDLNISKYASDSEESDEVVLIEDSSEEDVASRRTAISDPIPRNVHQQTTDVATPQHKSGNGSNVQPPKQADVNATTKNKVPTPPVYYTQQEKKVSDLKIDIVKVTHMLRTISLKSLPDGGKALNSRLQSLNEQLIVEQLKFNNMTLMNEEKLNDQKRLNWDKIHAATGKVAPETFGIKAMATFNAQKAMTEQCLENLHGSLKTCPDDQTLAEDPKGLIIDLMHHQKHALAWLMWRESQKPSGGVLADDMGLGKTLTMISLILKTLEEKEDSDDSNSDEETDEAITKRYKYHGNTLVVCPATLLNQWSGEVEARCKKNRLTVEIHHGSKREVKPRRLAKPDIVVTTYSLVHSESERNGALHNIRWRRVILDEAHIIRNYKAVTSIAVCKLSAKSRWALTGTPVHNKELDMYALLKFLRCSPFDDLNVWKRWVNNKSTGGQERLNAVIASLMLRRTKKQLQLTGMMPSLPPKNYELIEIKLDKQETQVYQKILIFSRTLFAMFLHQRAEKNTDLRDNLTKARFMVNRDPNGEYYKMYKKLLKFHKTEEVKSLEILVLLLRLRQMCCHPSLITEMLEGDIGETDDKDEMGQDIDLLEQVNKLNLNDDDDDDDVRDVKEGTEDTPSESASWILNESNPVFKKDRCSSKMVSALEIIKNRVLPNGDKAVVVSQWTSFLRLFTFHLKENNIKYGQLDGSVSVPKRMEIVDNFNNPSHSQRILLLSLTAGGVGLNLVGANHLLLLDLHWNPQLESQAKDRIYRFGQTKPVYIYKLMAIDTIEERIKALQDHKLQIANDLLNGAKINSNKLSINDLKMLFSM